MYDKISYRFLDHFQITEYVVNDMSLVNEDRVLMGHAGSIITLWDTSREMLTQDQKITMKQSIYDAFNPTEEM